MHEINDMNNCATPEEYDRVVCMTEVELWRNFQIYKNWLKVVGEKLVVNITETELNNLKFGCKVKNQLQAYTDIPLY